MHPPAREGMGARPSTGEGMGRGPPAGKVMGRAATGRGGDGAQGLGHRGSGAALSLGQCSGGAHEVRRGRSGTMHLGWIGALEVGGAQNGWGRGPGGAAWMQVSCRRAVLGRAELAGVHEASKKVGFVCRGRG